MEIDKRLEKIPPNNIICMRKLKQWTFEMQENGQNKKYGTLVIETVKTKKGESYSVETKEATKVFDSLTEAIKYIVPDENEDMKEFAENNEENDIFVDASQTVIEEVDSSRTTRTVKSEEIKQSSSNEELIRETGPESVIMKDSDTSVFCHTTEEETSHQKVVHSKFESQASGEHITPKVSDSGSEISQQSGSSQHILKRASIDELVKRDDKAEEFAEGVLRAHNEYRAKHDAPPLALNHEMSNYSMQRAISIASRNIINTPDSKYGESIYFQPSYQLLPEDPVNSWYSEGKHFTYGTNLYQMASGHFTQMIWKETSELGIGLAKSPGYGVYVVATYFPPGNRQGKFLQNVSPPKDIS